MTTLTLDEAQFLYNPSGAGDFCHSPTLSQTSDGALWVVWYAYPEDEHKNASLVLMKRFPGTSQWTRCHGLPQSQSGSMGNPVLFQDPSGTLRLLYVVLKGNYWTDAELNSIHSTDGGYTWSAPAQVWRNAA